MKNVLVVDDSAVVRAQIRVTLEDCGYSVIEAVDGFDGVAQSGSEKNIDLVICDINMPRMDGLGLIEKVRGNADERIASLPIVVLSTVGDPERVRKARRLGAQGWLVKPFLPEFLIKTVAKLTEAA